MSAASNRLAAAVAAELSALHAKHHGLRPEVVVGWARKNPKSALHRRFTWDDTKAAAQYRLWQARQLIVEVEVEYPDQKVRQVYVSLVQDRGVRGYASLVEIMSDKDRRQQFLSQALAEYERLGEKYRDLTELADVFAAVRKAGHKSSRRGRRAA